MVKVPLGKSGLDAGRQWLAENALPPPPFVPEHDFRTIDDVCSGCGVTRQKAVDCGSKYCLEVELAAPIPVPKAQIPYDFLEAAAKDVRRITGIGNFDPAAPGREPVKLHAIMVKGRPIKVKIPSIVDVFDEAVITVPGDDAFLPTTFVALLTKDQRGNKALLVANEPGPTFDPELWFSYRGNRNHEMAYFDDLKARTRTVRRLPKVVTNDSKVLAIETSIAAAFAVPPPGSGTIETLSASPPAAKLLPYS